MTINASTDQVRGKTIRLAWTEGPTKGAVHEHIFHDDGTVEWHAVSNNKEKSASDGAGSAHREPQRQQPDRPPYAAMQVTDRVCLISYLSQSGYTLSVVLNFGDKSIVGVASNEKSWTPVKGNFEVVH